MAHHKHESADHDDLHELFNRYMEQVAYDADGNLIRNDLDDQPAKKKADKPDPDGLDYLDEYVDE